MTKKKTIKGIILFVIFAVIFAYILAYISGDAEMMARIASAPRSLVGLGLLCAFISTALSGILDVTCIEVYGVKVGCGESIGLTFIASMLNLVLPLQLGSVVKAVYLKKKMSLAYSNYISVASGVAVMNLMIIVVQLIICLAVSAFKWSVNRMYIYVLIGLLLAAVACLVLTVKYQNLVLKILPFKKFTLPVVKGFFELISNKKAMTLVMVNLAVYTIMGGMRFYLIFSALGYQGMLLNSMLYYGLYTASTIVPVLPGNIGVGEVIVGIMNSIIGADVGAGVAIVMINRIYCYVATIVGALLAIYPTWRLYKRVDGPTVQK